MNKLVLALASFGAMLASSIAVPATAQTTSVKVPTCLQVQGITKQLIPCTGTVPVDSVTGNALSWTDIFSAALAQSGVGITYTDKSVAVLSANQAAGITAIIGVNSNRKAFAITPANDGRLYIGSGASGFFYPLYAGVTRSFSGADCPTNALFVTGQSAGTTLPISEG